MKLLGDNTSKITKDKNGENVPHLQIRKVVLVYCNTANNDHQQDSKILCTFIPNKSFGQLLDISPKCFMFLRGFSSEFSEIQAWFTDQHSKPLKIEDKTNISLVINESVEYRNYV